MLKLYLNEYSVISRSPFHSSAKIFLCTDVPWCVMLSLACVTYFIYTVDRTHTQGESDEDVANVAVDMTEACTQLLLAVPTHVVPSG